MLRDNFTLGDKFAIIPSETFQFAFVLQAKFTELIIEINIYRVNYILIQLSTMRSFFPVLYCSDRTFLLLDEDILIIK